MEANKSTTVTEQKQKLEAPSPPPAWVNAALVQEALRNSGVEGARVAALALRPAVAPGESYCSALYRATVTLASGGGERSLLAKGPPAGDVAAAAVRQGGHFRRETEMLVRLLPRMQALLDSATPSGFPPLGARCLLHGSSPEDFLLLEDLQPLGFRLADRRRGLGLRHSLLALRTLARYHAASAALLAEDPSIAELLGNPMRPEGTGTFEPFVNISLRLAANACRGWSGYEEFADFFNALKPLAMEKLAALLDRKSDNFNVIVHGDFWTNNMMFRYEGEIPTEMRMVDFQISNVASPAIDLLYFLSTSPSEDVSQRHEDLLVREYHAALQETMDLLGLRAPPLEALHEAMDAHGLFVVFGAACVLPLVKVESAPDVNATAGGDVDAGAFMYEDPAVKSWLQRVLPLYKRRGWLRITKTNS